MVRRAIGAILILAGSAMSGPAGAQGFSAGGAAGIAQSRGSTASPGVQGLASDGPAAEAGEPRALYGGWRVTDIDDIMPRGGLDADARRPRGR